MGKQKKHNGHKALYYGGVIGRGRGQDHCEYAALAERALHPDRPALGFDELLGDGETETGAGAAARNFSTVETLEDVGQRIWRDAGSRISHADPRVSTVEPGGHLDDRPGWRVLARIVDQDRQHLLEGAPISLHRQIGWWVAGDCAVGGQELCLRAHVFQQGLDGERLVAQLLPGVRACQRE